MMMVFSHINVCTYFCVKIKCFLCTQKFWLGTLFSTFIFHSLKKVCELTFLVKNVHFTGKYVLSGSSLRRCVGGSWDGEDPICVGLSQHHEYSTNQPPTILFRHENGAISQRLESSQIRRSRCWLRHKFKQS